MPSSAMPPNPETVNDTASAASAASEDNTASADSAAIPQKTQNTGRLRSASGRAGTVAGMTVLMVVLTAGWVWLSVPGWGWASGPAPTSLFPGVATAGGDAPGVPSLAGVQGPTLSAADRVELASSRVSAGWGGRGDATAVADAAGRWAPPTDVDDSWTLAVMAVVLLGVLVVVAWLIRRLRGERAAAAAGNARSDRR